MEPIHKKLQSLTLLIAEDDPSTLRWLVKVLSIYFKDVRGACDAMNALELFKEYPADVVISDIQMPQVDGLNFMQKIQSISPETIMVIMTAFNSQVYLNRAVEIEINLYLKKPIDIDELLVAISSYISKTECMIYSLSNEYFYDQNKKVAIFENKNIKLTRKEVLLLELLIKNKHSLVSIEEIEYSVWKEPVSADAIRMVVSGIRKKLHPRIIENSKGLGYKLNLD
jgi:DNA-binding response OmpR family regulator